MSSYTSTLKASWTSSLRPQEEADAALVAAMPRYAHHERMLTHAGACSFVAAMPRYAHHTPPLLPPPGIDLACV
jgi:hypothetical protein